MNIHLKTSSFIFIGAAMSELSEMLTGGGVYRQGRVLPSLRFLAFVSLCPDCDSHSSTSVNGYAANVGRQATATKDSALQCISKLRRTCETTLLRCRAASREAENNFERNLKMILMPEFTVPYAFHLLAFRPETPSGGLGNRSGESVDGDKMLRKRLKWLFEPMVKSLGESADNISFLLRQSEMLGHRYTPLDITGKEPSAVDMDLAQSKLKVICAAAREVLLKFVKKDVNLTPYPGGIQIPVALFSFAKSETQLALSTPEGVTRKDVNTDSGKKSVHFDDDDDDISLDGSNDGSAHKASGKNNLDALQLYLSPIPQSRSPGSSFGTPTSALTPASIVSNGKKRRNVAQESTSRRRRTSPASQNDTLSPTATPPEDVKKSRGGRKGGKQSNASSKAVAVKTNLASKGDDAVEESESSKKSSGSRKKQERSDPDPDDLDLDDDTAQKMQSSDDLDFQDEADNTSTVKKVSSSKKKSAKKPATKKPAAKKPQVKVGKSSRQAKRKVVASPASVGTKSSRASVSSVDTAGGRRSARLSRG